MTKGKAIPWPCKKLPIREQPKTTRMDFKKNGVTYKILLRYYHNLYSWHCRTVVRSGRQQQLMGPYAGYSLPPSWGRTDKSMVDPVSVLWTDTDGNHTAESELPYFPIVRSVITSRLVFGLDRIELNLIRMTQTWTNHQMGSSDDVHACVSSWHDHIQIILQG